MHGTTSSGSKRSPSAGTLYGASSEPARAHHHQQADLTASRPATIYRAIRFAARAAMSPRLRQPAALRQRRDPLVVGGARRRYIDNIPRNFTYPTSESASQHQPGTLGV